MSFRYDLTAVEILKLLGYTEPVGKDTLLQAEREKNLKLPPALFEFWSLAADSTLFESFLALFHDPDIGRAVYHHPQQIEHRYATAHRYNGSGSA